MTNHDIYGRRLCTVDHTRIGYFHMWEQYSEPIEASPLLGGAPAGVFSKVYAIVEFPTEVARIQPDRIAFIDEGNKMLNVYQQSKLQWLEYKPTDIPYCVKGDFK